MTNKMNSNYFKIKLNRKNKIKRKSQGKKNIKNNTEAPQKIAESSNQSKFRETISRKFSVLHSVNINQLQTKEMTKI